MITSLEVQLKGWLKPLLMFLFVSPPGREMPLGITFFFLESRLHVFHKNILTIMRNMLVVGTREIKGKNGFRGLLN